MLLGWGASAARYGFRTPADQPGDQAHGATMGVLGQFATESRPKVIQELSEQDEKQRAARIAAMQQGAQEAGQYNNGLARLLPKVYKNLLLLRQRT